MAFVANVFLKMDVVARLWIFDGRSSSTLRDNLMDR